MCSLGSGREAHDINQRGQIVGEDENRGVAFCPAVLWRPDGLVLQLEDLPGGVNWARARAINDRGEIVGDAAGTALNVEAVSWQGVTVEPLDPVGVEGFAFDVNNRGQIVGTVGMRDTGGRRAVMWQDHQPTVLPLRVGLDSDPGESIQLRWLSMSTESSWAVVRPFGRRRGCGSQRAALRALAQRDAAGSGE